MIKAVPLRVLFFDGESPFDTFGAKRYADELMQNGYRAPYPLPVWKVDDECFLVLHYGKPLLAGYKYLRVKNEVSDEEPVEVQVFTTPTIDEARRTAELPAPIKKTHRAKSEYRRPSEIELRAFLESLPMPSSRSGYQAGIIHALNYALRGIEPNAPEWFEYTAKASRKRIPPPPRPKKRSHRG